MEVATHSLNDFEGSVVGGGTSSRVGGLVISDPCHYTDWCCNLAGTNE